MYIRLFVAGAFMAASTLFLFQVGKVAYGSFEVGQTMALVSLSLMNIFLALNLRFPQDTAFQSSTFSNARLVPRVLWVVFGSILMTETRLFQAIFSTVSLTPFPVAALSHPRRGSARHRGGLQGIPPAEDAGGDPGHVAVPA